MGHNKTKTIVTIGNGVAAWCLHYYLKDSGVDVINISADNFFRPCSQNSTAINCLRGTTRGNSPLGDCIIDSMDEFESFFQTFNPGGVYEGHEYQILENTTIPKWERRYPEFFQISDNQFLSTRIQKKNLYHSVKAYFFDIQKFESWMKKNSKPSRIINDIVVDINKKEGKYFVKTRNEIFCADQVVLCTNHMTNLLAKNLKDEFKYYLDHSKPVTGGYLELDDADKLGFEYEKSFVLAIEKYHFIYRKEENRIQIGSSSKNKTALELPLKEQLDMIYNHIKEHVIFELPARELFSEKTGVRFKGYLRRPYWGKIDDDGLYAICGLYKNAWSFSFLAAKELVSKIASQEHLQ